MATTNSDPVELHNGMTTINTADLGISKPSVSPAPADALYPGGIPQPRGTELAEKKDAQIGANTDPTSGQGVEGEVSVWEARYSKRNFIGRIVFRIMLTIGLLAMATYTWGMGHHQLGTLTWILTAVVALVWLTLAFRMVQAHYSHYYRLTNRRLFLSTGVIKRRRDMMELLKVKDVFTRQQSLLERWLGLGTVVIVPSEKELPTFYLAGVNDPKQVMDLIWHHARAERDQRSLKVENV